MHLWNKPNFDKNDVFSDVYLRKRVFLEAHMMAKG